MTIKTKDKNIVIYPDVKIEHMKRQIKNINTVLKMMDKGELIKLQIDLYKRHFINFSTAFRTDNNYESILFAEELNNYIS